MSSRALADAILPYLRPEDQIIQYGDFNSGSSIPFYTHRHVWIYNGRFGTNLEIGSNYPDALPPNFLTTSSSLRFGVVQIVCLFLSPKNFARTRFPVCLQTPRICWLKVRENIFL